MLSKEALKVLRELAQKIGPGEAALMAAEISIARLVANERFPSRQVQVAVHNAFLTGLAVALHFPGYAAKLVDPGDITRNAAEELIENAPVLGVAKK